MGFAGRGSMVQGARPTPAAAAEAGSERNGKAAGTVRKGTVAVGTAARRYGLAAAMPRGSGARRGSITYWCRLMGRWRSAMRGRGHFRSIGCRSWPDGR